ncbi:hypothetical protein Mal15_31200 [Stieleria maiorica]|uniref:Uncharacterized protein n=1 Tax=Stieleria maiorica TaxID=2795974 RepID=A0A5B9MCK6_9BACT|nr:hypothetical protein [Stieleria maiorica]QEF99061.1 hypothetical protein Mal15_31200 [Stieleria maiorica]
MSRRLLHSVAALLVLSAIVFPAPADAQEMRVRDLIVPDNATQYSMMKRRGDVRFQLPSDFKSVGNLYAQKLTEQGWRKSARDNLQSSFWVQTFAKGNVLLVVRVSEEGGGTAVRLTPTGMMWEEDDQPTPKELPIPDDATDLEYSDFFETVEFKSPSDLKTTQQYLVQELEKRNWKKDATTMDFAHYVSMTFSQKKSSLTVNLTAEDDGCEVEFRTKGMQWDGMKEEIARAKKEAKQAKQAAKKMLAETAPDQDVAEPALDLPPRQAKPKQGIADMPKLQNKGTVVMDGTTYDLPHVIAYEVFQYDEWKTKIVATQKTVKQDSLLSRLRKTGSDENDDGGPSWPQPHLLIVLDADDQPRQLSLQAGGTPGHGSGDELVGSALVEDGRARGTVALKEPGDFFDKVYTAEISFDVPVLTRDSTPAKQLAGAPKLPNSGKLTLGGRTYNLSHVVAYPVMFFDDPMTAIVFSERPLNMNKLTAALGRPAADDYFEFIPQIKLLVDAEDNVSSLSIWADNNSIGSNSNLDDAIVIEDGRARGTARMSKPAEFLDSTYSFEVSLDVDVLGQKTSATREPVGGLPADSYDALPVPQGHEGIQAEGSPFRKVIQTTVAADLDAVVDFYRRQLGSGQWGKWDETVADAKIDRQSASLTFTGPGGGLTVQLAGKGDETAITMVSRDAQAAKAAGLWPTPGKARLFIANDTASPAVLTINRRDYTIAAGAGARDPKTGINWEVAPGNYTIELKTTGGSGQSEKLKIQAGTTTGVIVTSSGAFMKVDLY